MILTHNNTLQNNQLLSHLIVFHQYRIIPTMFLFIAI